MKPFFLHFANENHTGWSAAKIPETKFWECFINFCCISFNMQLREKHPLQETLPSWKPKTGDQKSTDCKSIKTTMSINTAQLLQQVWILSQEMFFALPSQELTKLQWVYVNQIGAYKILVWHVCSLRPLLVDYSFMVICCIWAWQSFFTAFELIITSKFWEMNKKQ